MLINSKFKIIMYIPLLLLPGCSFERQSIPKYTYLIQLLSNSTVLVSIKEAITLIINKIVKEELNLEKDYAFDFFIPKEPQPQYLTVYYVDGMQEKAESILLSAIENTKKINRNYFHKISIMPKINFFGDDKDELVLMVNDPQQELLQLNSEIKESVHQANNQYEETYHENLYDIAKSEKYPYLPHIGLGRIRSNSIKQHVKDISQIDTIFERIRQRSTEAVLHVIEKSLTIDNQKLFFDKMRIFNLQKRLEVMVSSF